MTNRWEEFRKMIDEVAAALEVRTIDGEKLEGVGVSGRFNTLMEDAMEFAYRRGVKDALDSLATFPRISQNQTVSSGVEGAHEGTTADKSGSREPEKLNNAHYDAITCTNDRSVALAESSLSSPSPNSDLSAPTSPVPTGLSVEPAESRTAKEIR